jgi:glycosyltransferase involved in cell wall biosynthesis
MASVSVIIPAFNAAAFIEAAILSAVGQTVQPFEILVVDDGSTDATAEIAAGFSPKVRVILRPHLGGSSTLNVGVEQAQSEMLAFLDADDVWSKQKLELQLNFLRQHHDVDAVFCHVIPFDDNEGIPDISSTDANKRKMPGLNKSSMLIRASAFHSVGPFNLNFKIADFPEWYARAKDKGVRWEVLPEVLVFRRIHGKNTSVTQKVELRAEYIKLVRESLRRHGK